VYLKKQLKEKKSVDNKEERRRRKKSITWDKLNSNSIFSTGEIK